MNDQRDDGLLSWGESRKEALKGVGGLAAMGFFVFAFGTPFLIIGWQCLEWLQTGIWQRWPLSRALALFNVHEPTFEWVGVQKIVGYIWQSPTAAVIPMASVGLLWLGGVGLLEWEKSRDAKDAAQRLNRDR